MSKFSYQKFALQYQFDSADYTGFLAKVKFWCEHVNYALQDILTNAELLTQEQHMVSKCITIYMKQCHQFAVDIYRNPEDRGLNYALLQIQFFKAMYWMQWMINELEYIPEEYMFELQQSDFVEESEMHIYSEMLEDLDDELKQENYIGLRSF
jgi:hypothetical protein